MLAQYDEEVVQGIGDASKGYRATRGALESDTVLFTIGSASRGNPTAV